MFLDIQERQQMTCHYKLSLQYFKCLKSRATRICETEDLEAEKDHLRTTFQRNGYPEGFITSAMKLRTGQEVQQTLTEASNRRRKTLSILLYVKGTSDRIADICRKSGVPSVFLQKTIYTEGSTYKSEGTTEAHGHGCGVPDPLCTVQ